MRFDYAEREVDPLPDEFGLQIIHEPIVVVRFIGPHRTYLIRGLLDTGASLTLLPRSYFHKLGMGAGSAERARLRSVAGPVDIVLGSVDLELRSQRAKYRWSAQVGFVPRADNLALIGHAGSWIISPRLSTACANGSRSSRTEAFRNRAWGRNRIRTATRGSPAYL